MDAGLKLDALLGELLQSFLRCFHLVVADIGDFFGVLAACFEIGHLPAQIVERGLVMDSFGADLLEMGKGLIAVSGESFKLVPGSGFIIGETLQVGGFLMMFGPEALKRGGLLIVLSGKRLDGFEPFTMSGLGLGHRGLDRSETLFLGAKGFHAGKMHGTF